MNKRTVRAFALGILFSVSLIGTYYYFFQNENGSISKAKQTLEDKGFIVLSQSEFTKLQKHSHRKSEAEQYQETAENAEKSIHTNNDHVQASSVAEENKIISYELKITDGMNTEQIATILANVRIIEDAEDFEEYLSKNGYSTRIQLGTFLLTNEMDYSQIAKILTKS
ncbi:aminodeoxychorismate lyase [Bacillus methanolicus]|uniref:aminodeoxychorismate lyase n=1 Tax=Bacillus methanolicus TaxID=1471 RepID=UPI0023802CDF|nr:aminodeoxychorismate lyase [Bacillus methanolicus]MDE3839603.1 aminodeoxychorismate lyase [Bacillus methanolicus]